MGTKPRNGNGKKGDPQPTRFDPQEQEFLDQIHDLTGLSKAEIVRRACRFALPKFLRREVNIIDVVPLVDGSGSHI